LPVINAMRPGTSVSF